MHFKKQIVATYAKRTFIQVNKHPNFFRYYFHQEQQRDVVLFRYMSWPENDVPENPKSFVNFLLEAIKANQAKEDSKLVAHCR